MADSNLQNIVDQWSNQLVPTGYTNPSFGPNGYPNTGMAVTSASQDGEVTNAFYAPRFQMEPSGIQDFLKTNPVVSAQEFSGLTNNQPGFGLQTLLSQQAPKAISDVFNQYATTGENALKNVASPQAADMTQYKDAASMAGQYNAQGGVNLQKVATDYQTQQETKIANFQTLSLIHI